MAKILLAEDEANIASFIKRGLDEFGHSVDVAGDGEAAWLLIQENEYDLLILDIIMPKLSGLDLCRLVRSEKGFQIPVLMLTALSTTEDIVAGLEAGADDYIVKPFRFQELQARIKALLRRYLFEQSNEVLVCQDLTLDCNLRIATRGTLSVELTDKEFRLLQYFISHQGQVLSRSVLLKFVWDKDFDTNTNVVDVYVNYLRNKIDKGFETKLIRTVVSVGYIMGA